MSFPYEFWTDPHPKVRAAMDKVGGIIGGWVERHTHPDAARDIVCHWDGVTLQEALVAAVLEAEGFDLEGLELMVEHMRPGEHVRDVYAVFDRDGFDDKAWDECTGRYALGR